jgi:hypothetical protein
MITDPHEIKRIINIYIEDYPLGGEVFTHKDEGGTLRTFAVCLMNRFAKDLAATCDLIATAEMKIEADDVVYCRTKMGIEQARLDRLVDPWLHMPLMFVAWPNVSLQKGCTVVDGNHRLVNLYESGERLLTGYIFHPDLWQHFLITVPDQEERLTRPPGVIEHERMRG